MIRTFILAIILLFSSSLFSQITYPGTPTVGPIEMVYDYSVSNCNVIDIPDKTVAKQQHFNSPSFLS